MAAKPTFSCSGGGLRRPDVPNRPNRAVWRVRFGRFGALGPPQAAGWAAAGGRLGRRRRPVGTAAGDCLAAAAGGRLCLLPAAISRGICACRDARSSLASGLRARLNEDNQIGPLRNTRIHSLCREGVTKVRLLGTGSGRRRRRGAAGQGGAAAGGRLAPPQAVGWRGLRPAYYADGAEHSVVIK